MTDTDLPVATVHRRAYHGVREDEFYLEGVPTDLVPTLRPPNPGRHIDVRLMSWDRLPVVVAVSALERVGVTVPDEVRDFLIVAHTGLEDARTLTADSRRPVVAQVEAGQLDTAKAADKLAKLPGPRERSELREASFVAAQRAYEQAAAALAGAGDEIIAGPLRDMGRALLEDASVDEQQAWARVWDAVRALRSGGFASSADDLPIHADMFGRLDLVQAWRYSTLGPYALRYADGHVSEAHAIRLPDGSTGTLLVRATRPGGYDLPDPTPLAVAREHRDTWAPDVYSATEIVESVRTILARQRRWIDAAQ